MQGIEPYFPGTWLMPPAPQMQAMYGDPRLQGIRNHGEEERAGFLRAEERILGPTVLPQNTKSRFVFVEYHLWNPEETPDPFRELLFLDKPDGYNDDARWGGGLGFAFIDGKHVLRGVLNSKVAPPDILVLPSGACAIAAPRVVRVLQDFGVDQLETLKIEWSVDSSPALKGYVFLDARRLIDAYDYENSEVVFRKIDGRMLAHLGRRLTFRNDIDPDVHMFRDMYNRRRIVISRSLWRHLRAQNVSGVYAVDPASSQSAEWHEKLAGGGE